MDHKGPEKKRRKTAQSKERFCFLTLKKYLLFVHWRCSMESESLQSKDSTVGSKFLSETLNHFELAGLLQVVN